MFDTKYHRVLLIHTNIHTHTYTHAQMHKMVKILSSMNLELL